MLSSKKAIAVVSASALALGTCVPLALADDQPSVDGQTGKGTTEMTVKALNAGHEYGGTEELKVIPAPPGTDSADLVGETGKPDPNGEYILNPAYNPDGSDADEWGDNLAFSVPSKINFIMKANGDLMAPTSDQVYIDNESAYPIHVTSLDIDPGITTGTDTWNIVEDKAHAGTTANSAWGSIGPSGSTLGWSSYLNKTNVPTASAAEWNMAADDSTAHVVGTPQADELHLATSGGLANVSVDLAEFKTFAKVHWYLASGAAEENAQP